MGVRQCRRALCLGCFLLLLHGTSSSADGSIQYNAGVISEIFEPLSIQYNKSYIAYWGMKSGGIEFKLQVNISLQQQPWTSANIEFGNSLQFLSKQIPGMQWSGIVQEQNGIWTRTLVYTPYKSHVNHDFTIDLNISAKNQQQSTWTTYTFQLYVYEYRPAFVDAWFNASVYKLVNGSLQPQQDETPSIIPWAKCVAASNSPTPCISRVNAAVSNCEMPPFAVVVQSLDSIFNVNFTNFLWNVQTNAVIGQARLSQPLFVRNVTASANIPNDVMYADGRQTYLIYANVSWLPETKHMGSVVDICIEVHDRYASNQRCILVEVLPCFYCTSPKETLLTIARLFQTDWAQIWSANVATRLPISLNGISTWQTPENLDDMPSNVAIRLGPVFTPSVDTALSWLLWNFQVSIIARACQT